MAGDIFTRLTAQQQKRTYKIELYRETKVQGQLEQYKSAGKQTLGMRYMNS